MIVWYCIPTAAPIEQANVCLEAWHDMGYSTATIFEDDRRAWRVKADLQLLQNSYPGYSASVNKLVREVLERTPACMWIVTGGDDVFPDPTHRADEIEAELDAHFGGTFGVMQPTGGDLSWSPNASRIAWSPWVGREFCRRANGGRGPFWPAYHHGWADLELRVIAERNRVFWVRPDLTHEHRTWKAEQHPVRPAHLHHVADSRVVDEALFNQREAAGFPGSEMLS